MSRFWTNLSRRRSWVAVGTVLVMFGLAIPTRAQSNRATVGASATSTDAYGNAQFGLPERRPLGIFRFDRGGGEGRGTLLDRNHGQRGGDTLFSLPGDILGLSTMSMLTNTVSPGVSTTVPKKKAESFYLYGGFGKRNEARFQDPVSVAFARRSLLMEATSQAAPVYRALVENSSMAGIRTAVVRTPFAETGKDQSLDSPISLFQRLDDRAESLRARARGEAWGLFGDGAYRPAARAFESVLVLSPEDLSVRIGQIFCHVNLGAIRTAMAIVNDLKTHTDNVFSGDVDMTARFGDPRLADELSTNARLSLESVAKGRSPDLDATYILVLWYLGKREDAARSAFVLSRKAGAANYADWPAKMRAIERGSGESGDSDESNPPS